MPHRSFPEGAHLKGGAASAPLNRALAEEFYRDILPLVVELRRQGLSLRGIGRELDQRGIKPRFEYPGQRWSASQVRRLLIRAGVLASRPAPAPRPTAPSKTYTGAEEVEQFFRELEADVGAPQATGR
jgi:hypothetical protein